MQIWFQLKDNNWRFKITKRQRTQIPTQYRCTSLKLAEINHWIRPYEASWQMQTHDYHKFQRFNIQPFIS